MKLRTLVPTVEEPSRPSTAEIPQPECAGSPRVNQRPYDTWAQDAITKIRPVEASTSWWVGKSREELSELVKAQQIRLANSRIVEPFKAK